MEMYYKNTEYEEFSVQGRAEGRSDGSSFSQTQPQRPKIMNKSLKIQLIRKDLQVVVCTCLTAQNMLLQKEDSKNLAYNKTRKNPVKRRIDDFSSYYIEKETLGQGGHGVVKRVTRIDNNEEFACKIIRSDDPEIVKQIIIEFENCFVLQHRSIMKAYELYIDDMRSQVFFVMELLIFPSLKKWMNKNETILERQAMKIIYMTLKAVEYMHKKGICHRDLTPSNILVSDDLSRIKIIDLGVSKNFFKTNFDKSKGFHVKEVITMHTSTGVLAYTAPEIHQGGGYNELVDLWSLGIITYELIFQTRPFDADYVSDTIDNIVNKPLELPDMPRISSVTQDFIKRLLNKDPSKRLSASDAINHPWFQVFRANKKKSNEFKQVITTPLDKLPREFGRENQVMASPQYQKKSEKKSPSPNNLKIYKKRNNSFTHFSENIYTLNEDASAMSAAKIYLNPLTRYLASPLKKKNSESIRRFESDIAVDHYLPSWEGKYSENSESSSFNEHNKDDTSFDNLRDHCGPLIKAKVCSGKLLKDLNNYHTKPLNRKLLSKFIPLDADSIINKHV